LSSGVQWRAWRLLSLINFLTKTASSARVEGGGRNAVRHPAGPKTRVRYTAIYTDENGRYKSAGAYDSEERALQVADQHERHVRLRLAETSPADKATITIRDFGVKFLREHAVEPNSKMTYAQLLNSHVYPFIGKRRVAEIGRETIHRLLTVVRPEEGASQNTIVNVRTCLSAMLQMAWDHGYRGDNPVKGSAPAPPSPWTRSSPTDRTPCAASPPTPGADPNQAMGRGQRRPVPPCRDEPAALIELERSVGTNG